MPIVHQKEHLSCFIAIWQITENFDELLQLAKLSSGELATFHAFKSDSRKKEYLTVRALLKTIYPEQDYVLFYDKHGKPHLNDRGISISHSKEYVAMITGEFYAGGIDIETIDDRIFILANKFLNEAEKKYLGENPSRDTLQIVWGAKEILYKIHSIGDLDFKKHLMTYNFTTKEKGQLDASITKLGYEKAYTIYYEKIDSFMISWGTSN